ncbi:MAG TPA: hypothetical protein VGL91_01065 [Acidobacteriota bacterium]
MKQPLPLATLIFGGILWVAFSASSAMSQGTSVSQQPPEEDCLRSAPLFDVNEFPGPFKRIAAFVSPNDARKTVHPRHHRPGATPCSLEPRERFGLFLSDSFDPATFFTRGVEVGWSQFLDDDSKFGQGTRGFAKRYGAAFTDNVSRGFFTTFLYPSIFDEDPRYYPLAHGPNKRRLLHGMSHIVVAQKNSGRPMFNFSKWLGLGSAVALSNLYHPNNHRGFGPAARRVGVSIAFDMGSDVLQEFWPEISHKLKLPFVYRDHQRQGKSRQ